MRAVWSFLARNAGKTTGPKTAGPGVASALSAIFLRRELIPFLPAIGLAGLWFGPDAWSLLAATACAVAWLTRPPIPAQSAPSALSSAQGAPPPATQAGLPQRAEAAALLDELLRHSAGTGCSTACLVAGIDHAHTLRQRVGPLAFEALVLRLADRLRATLRDADRIARLEDDRFAILLTPTPRPDLETMIQLAVRLQTSCELPVSLGARSVIPSLHIGICLPGRAPEPGGHALLMAAETAAKEAALAGSGAIRVYSGAAPAHEPVHEQTPEAAAQDLASAIALGQISAGFQPQISTDTGAVSGMRVLPGWRHVQRGPVDEAEILGTAARQDLALPLFESLLQQGLAALRQWQRLGTQTGPLGIPVTVATLSEPGMAERLRWELERQDVTADHICLVLHEGAPTDHDSGMAGLHNLTACTEMGCRLEVPPPGCSPLLLGALQQGMACRMRLPQAMVARADHDPAAQRMAAALIAMAERLGLETLAESALTTGESAILAQLGCNHLQGDAVAPPMTPPETAEWMKRHNAKLAATPRLPRHKGA